MAPMLPALHTVEGKRTAKADRLIMPAGLSAGLLTPSRDIWNSTMSPYVCGDVLMTVKYGPFAVALVGAHPPVPGRGAMGITSMVWAGTLEPPKIDQDLP